MVKKYVLIKLNIASDVKYIWLSAQNKYFHNICLFFMVLSQSCLFLKICLKIYFIKAFALKTSDTNHSRMKLQAVFTSTGQVTNTVRTQI